MSRKDSAFKNRGKPIRRIIFGLLGVLGILFGILLIIPFFLNINDYKPQIIAKAKATLRRDVAIEGNLSLSLLPNPQISIEQARIGNLSGGSPHDLLRVKRLRLSVDFLPLLKKQIKIKTIELDHPDIFLEKLEDGRVNWDFKRDETSALSPSASANTSSQFDVALDKIQVHQGRLVYHEKGKDLVIQEINANSKLDTRAGPYTIVGALKAFDQNVKVNMKLGELGDIQDVALTIQVGGVSSTLEGQLSLPSLTFKGALKATGDPQSLKTLFSQDKASPLLSGPLRMDAAVVANAAGISLHQAQFEIGAAHPTGNLKVDLQGPLQIEGSLKNLPGHGQCAFTLSPSPQGFAGHVNATVGKTKELLNWLAVETKAMPPEVWGPLTLSTHFNFSDTIRLKDINLIIRDAKVYGDIVWQTKRGTPALIVDLKSPKIENIFKLMGVKDPKPLGIGSIKGSLQGGATSFNVTNLKGQLGSHLSFSGNVAIDHAGVKPKIKATLSINSINVDTLLASRQMGNQPYPNGKIFLISAKRPPSPSRWSHTPLDFSFLNKFDGQFDISASQLRQKDIVISHPKLVAKVQNGRLDITSLTGSIFEGAFQGSGHLTADNALRFRISLKDANLKNLLTPGANVKIVAGKLSLTSDLSTHGDSMDGMIRHLTGPVAMTAKDGVINGFDLPALSQRLGNLKNLQSVLGLLTTSMGKGQTPFSSFKGDLVFKDGVGDIHSMNLTAQGGQGQASGYIDLPRYVLDIHTDFRLTEHPNLPPFRMHLTGPIDNPSRKVDSAALQKYMMDHVFKNVIEKLGKGHFKPADILGSILGNGKPLAHSKEAQSAPQQQPNKDRVDKPEQIVKDIFKGIF